MGSKKVQENYLSEDIYYKKNLIGKKILIIFIFLLAISFISNFPLKLIIKNQVASLINNFENKCPITYKDIKVSFFLPQISLTSSNISGRCFKKPNINFKLDKAKLFFLGPSIYPLGLKLKAEITYNTSKINIYFIKSFRTDILKIEDTIISANLINKFIKGDELLFGTISLESLIDIKNMKISSLDLLVKSNNIGILPQNIQGFEIPSLNLQNLSFKGNYNGKELKLISAIIGTEMSPIYAKLNGTIIPSPNVSFSQLNINGEIKFSEQLLNDVPLGLLLNNKTTENGFYKVKVGGTVARPNAKIL